jgi:phenylacetate-CoA ligase
MIIFRAVNIYPGQIDEILSGIPEIGCEYQVVIERRTDGKDYMTLRIECARDKNASQTAAIEKKISQEIKNKIMVSCNVELVDECSLPRSERKTKRIFDRRPDV